MTIVSNTADIAPSYFMRFIVKVMRLVFTFQACNPERKSTDQGWLVVFYRIVEVLSSQISPLPKRKAW